MNHADYERRLHECLDRREDPLDDARVQQYLLQHPEAVEEFADRQHLLATLAPHRASPRVPTGHRWPWLLAAAAAVAAAAVLAMPGTTAAPSHQLLDGSLTERTAPCAATLSWRTREVLVQTPTTTLEIVEQGSIRR